MLLYGVLVVLDEIVIVIEGFIVDGVFWLDVEVDFRIVFFELCSWLDEVGVFKFEFIFERLKFEFLNKLFMFNENIFFSEGFLVGV